MTVPVSLSRAAGLLGAILLSAGMASPGAARDGSMTVAQNPPPGQGDDNKDHKKDHGDKGQQQKGPQGAAPSHGSGQPPGPGNGQQQGQGPG